MTEQHYFSGKKILITGGSSGIGYALAERLTRFNPAVIVLLSHESQKLQAAAERLQAKAPHLHIAYLVADIADSTSVHAACSKMIADFGVPDIVVNNAGYTHYLLFHEMPEDEMVRHANVNFIGAMRVVHALLPAMREKKCGQIVNVASIAGHMVMTPNLVYSASKHGMVAWSEGLAAELAADGITVQIVSPGRVVTDFFRHESFQKRVAGKETQLTVSMDKVIDAIIHAMVKKKKLTVVPSYWSFVAWTIRSFPFLVKPIYHILLQKRVNRLRN